MLACFLLPLCAFAEGEGGLHTDPPTLTTYITTDWNVPAYDLYGFVLLTSPEGDFLGSVPMKDAQFVEADELLSFLQAQSGVDPADLVDAGLPVVAASFSRPNPSNGSTPRRILSSSPGRTTSTPPSRSPS